MAQQGFGADDFERLARQYWNQWGEAIRAAAPAQPQAPGWQAPGWSEALDWWSQLARGGNPAVDDVVSRFDTQARSWLGRMQQVAAQFAGRDASAAEVAQAWKSALGGQAGGPFADMFRGMGGHGQHGVEQWFEQAAPYLRPYLQQWQSAGQGNAGSWLDLPAFGFAREHQERWQQLLQAQIDAREQAQAYHALMAEAGQDAFVRFERKLGERSEAGQPLTSARALFDLWVDAAEESYADIALSPRFRDAYAQMVNAQMRLRGRVQEEVEQVGELLGMPTRTEVDSAHRKIVQLERELRRLRERLSDDEGTSPSPATKPRPARKRATGQGRTAKSVPTKKPASAKKSTPAKKSTARKTATAGKPAASRKPARAKGKR